MAGENSSMLRYRIVCAMAIVAVAFSVIVSVLMVSNCLMVRTSSPLNLTAIEQLRATLKTNPADEAVKAKIRDVDLLARTFYFGGLTSLRTGSYLLLCGVGIALVCLKTMVVIKRGRVAPTKYPPATDGLEASAMARMVIGGVAVALITGAVVIAVMEGSGGNTESVPAVKVGMAEAITNWPGFRGIDGSGSSSFTNLPVSWDVKTSNNILWVVNVPLPGMSSPIVWGNRVFLTGATDEKREVYCYDLASGIKLWSAGVDAAPGNTNRIPQVNKDTGFAASTPVTDGVTVYSIFANGDLGAIDFCAKKMWTVDLGLPDNRYGYSTSLALYGRRVLVQFDTGSEKGGTSQLIALDSGTGKKVWSTVRPAGDSWPSPSVVQTDAGPQLITVANEWIISYDPVKGDELWRVKCSGSDVAPSPVCAGGLIIAVIPGDGVYAIRPTGRGEVTTSHVVWKSANGASDVASPVSNGELVFLAQSSGALTCLDVKTGKLVWERNLDAEFYASPGLAGDTLYLVARSGEVFILKCGRQYEDIGRAHIGEPSDCSPAFVNGRILIRGITHLFCIGIGST